MKRNHLLPTALCLSLLAGGLVACSSSDDPTTPAGNTDDVAPEVVATNPTDGSGGVGVDDSLYVWFSEAMDAATAAGNVTLTGGTLTGTTWNTDRLLVVGHSDFAEGTEITLTVGTGLADEAGNNLEAAHVTQFTTVSSNLLIMDITPGDGDTGQPTNTGVRIRFSENVSTQEILDHVLLTDILVLKDAQANYDFTVEGLDESTYLLTPTSDLPASTTIYVYVSSLIQSYSGKNPVSSYHESFTTGTGVDTTPPTLLSVEPANGDTNVPADQGFIRMTFSEPINDDTFDLDTYNLGFMFYLEWMAVGPVTWSPDFTVLTVPLPSPLPAGLPIDLTFSAYEDLNGVEQTTPLHYAFTIAGSADYLPFVDGQRFVDDFEWQEGALESPPSNGGDDERYIEIDFQTDGSFREVEYESPGLGEDPFTTTTGRWDAFRETSSAFQWLGWQDEITVPGKANDFDPPLTVLPLPIAAGTWTGTSTITVEGEGTFNGVLNGRVLPQQDYVIPESGGEAFVKDAWIVILEIEADMGGEPAVAMEDTIVFVPTFGPWKTYSYQENYDESRWEESTTLRWPYLEQMMMAKRKRFGD